MKLLAKKLNIDVDGIAKNSEASLKSRFSGETLSNVSLFLHRLGFRMSLTVQHCFLEQ